MKKLKKKIPAEKKLVSFYANECKHSKCQGK